MPSSLELTRNRLVRAGRSLYGDGRGRTLLVVATGWLAILGGRYLFPAILPQVRDFFGISNATAGLANEAFVALAALTAIGAVCYVFLPAREAA